MCKVTEFKTLQTTKEPTTFSGFVERDLMKLADKLGITREEALRTAKNFYKQYPMLIEFVRSPEQLFRGDEPYHMEDLEILCEDENTEE